MSVTSFYVRKMLMQYDRQLVADRRIRRHLSVLGSAGHNAGEPSAEEKRKALVERVAQEVFENLIFAGSDNPIVHDVKDSLEDELGEKLTFKFPPAKLDFEIYRETPEGLLKVSEAETPFILNKLWDITLEKVNNTML